MFMKQKILNNYYFLKLSLYENIKFGFVKLTILSIIRISAGNE